MITLRAQLLAAGLVLALGAATSQTSAQEVVPPDKDQNDGGMVLIDPEKPLTAEIEHLQVILDEDEGLLETIAKADHVTVYKLAPASEDSEIDDLDGLDGYTAETTRVLDDLDREAIKRVIINRELWGREREELESEEISDMEPPFQYAIRFVRGEQDDADEEAILFIRQDQELGTIGQETPVDGLIMWEEDDLFLDDQRYFEVNGHVLFPYLEALQR